MKYFCTIWISLLLCLSAKSQTREIDSLKEIVNRPKIEQAEGAKALARLISILIGRLDDDSAFNYVNKVFQFLPNDPESSSLDTTSVQLLLDLGMFYQFTNLDSALIITGRALRIAQRLDYLVGEVTAAMYLGEHFRLHGDFSRAIEYLYQAQKLNLKIGDTVLRRMNEGTFLGFLGVAYAQFGEYRRGLNYLLSALTYFPEKSDITFLYFTYSNIGYAYEKLNMLDSALYFQENALHKTRELKLLASSLEAQILDYIGLIYKRMGNKGKARQYFHQSIDKNDRLELGTAQYQLADLYYSSHQTDSALYYARLGFINSRRSDQNKWLMDASRLLVKIFSDKRMVDSAFHYQSVAIALQDSFYSPQKFDRLQVLAVEELESKNALIEKQKEAEKQREDLAVRTRTYTLLGILSVLAVIGIILYRNNRQQQRANTLLSRQKEEIALALARLKSTQAQLVQSEKMASLGELTAGIAHEIQNPLNFVNNFSEVNRELIEEMKEQIDKGNTGEVKSLALAIYENEEKIMHHGKRADNIVKGMLQHSRTHSDTKEPTDINALAEEYLRLAYHGFRTREKDFQVSIHSQLDNQLEKINLIPQEMGRALLNLYNNAFYSMAEKKKLSSQVYLPELLIETKKLDKEIIIRIRDNGMGISEKVRQKIFQPFFTTKPTGQGTGLGLSLSYDIIVKQHGGSISAESREGEFAEFNIRLPLQDIG